MNISVAMCTCNGQRFLLEQLQSLASQSRLPDELIICDDASDDQTVSIVKKFQSIAPFPIRLVVNSSRLGLGANFQQVITLCMGDIIFLSDQDDVWHIDKLARFESHFFSNPEIDFAAADAKVVDQSLRPFDYTLWNRVKFTLHEQQLARDGRMFEVLLKHYVVAGSTMAFRSNLRELLLPIPDEWPYDAWLVIVAAALASVRLINEPLQEYRQHEGNLVGGRKRNLLCQVRDGLSIDRAGYYREEIGRWQRLFERMVTCQARRPVVEALAAKLKHLETRAGLPTSRWLRLSPIGAEVLRGGYARYARNWGSLTLDLLIR